MGNNHQVTKQVFAKAEEAETYDRWFRAKVQASLDDQSPTIPHDEVMAELRKMIEATPSSDAPDSQEK